MRPPATIGACNLTPGHGDKAPSLSEPNVIAQYDPSADSGIVANPIPMAAKRRSRKTAVYDGNPVSVRMIAPGELEPAPIMALRVECVLSGYPALAMFCCQVMV